MESRVEKLLRAIADLNTEFLDALADCAKSRPEFFPLPHGLRADFSRLTYLQCRDRGQYGILFADASFADGSQWRVAIHEDPKSFSDEDAPWLSGEHGLLIAHSVLVVAWHVVQSMPSLVGVLLGMSDAVAREFEHMRVSDLTYVARSQSICVQPRWAARADLWAGLIGSGQTGSTPKPFTNLRLLKASATDSECLLKTVSAVARVSPAVAGEDSGGGTAAESSGLVP